jgi:TrmH family RNA methyltransferase
VAAEPPIVVLVRAQLGQNIGKAARAMLNFGLTELRLVTPRDGWPNPEAGPAASGADVVLEQAQVFATVADAIADCSTVYASTVRPREVMMPVLTPEEMTREIASGTGRSAILFGPERAGLETNEVALANAIVTVPVNPGFGSLNLAQAVIVMAYEWSRHWAGDDSAAGKGARAPRPARRARRTDGPARRSPARQELLSPAGANAVDPEHLSHNLHQGRLVVARNQGRPRHHPGTVFARQTALGTRRYGPVARLSTRTGVR